MSSAKAFRRLLDRDEILICPGVHDPLTARVVDMVGFDAMHMTGFGTTLSRSGYPDVGLATMPEVTENARRIDVRVDVPVFCDADDGYGDVKNVIRTVEEFVHTGVAGIHIEDQTTPKRGIVGGHRVVSEEQFLSKIRAACDVRDEHDGDFVIAARSDAPGATNASTEDAVSRLNAAVDAGADWRSSSVSRPRRRSGTSERRSTHRWCTTGTGTTRKSPRRSSTSTVTASSSVRCSRLARRC